MTWKVEPGYNIINENTGLPYIWPIQHDSHESFIIYNGTDVWRLANGRCRPITTYRFEKLLKKALRLGNALEKRLNEGHMWLKTHTSDYEILVCEDHLEDLQNLGLFDGEKFIIPKKFNNDQSKYAIEYYSLILSRVRRCE